VGILDDACDSDIPDNAELGVKLCQQLKQNPKAIVQWREFDSSLLHKLISRCKPIIFVQLIRYLFNVAHQQPEMLIAVLRARDNDNCTPLHLALHLGYPSAAIMLMLLEPGEFESLFDEKTQYGSTRDKIDRGAAGIYKMALQQVYTIRLSCSQGIQAINQQAYAESAEHFSTAAKTLVELAEQERKNYLISYNLSPRLPFFINNLPHYEFYLHQAHACWQRAFNCLLLTNFKTTASTEQTSATKSQYQNLLLNPLAILPTLGNNGDSHYQRTLSMLNLSQQDQHDYIDLLERFAEVHQLITSDENYPHWKIIFNHQAYYQYEYEKVAWNYRELLTPPHELSVWLRSRLSSSHPLNEDKPKSYSWTPQYGSFTNHWNQETLFHKKRSSDDTASMSSTASSSPPRPRFEIFS